MRAILCTEFGAPELLKLEQVAEPTPGAGEIGIAVEAAGVSFADTLMIRDLHQNKHPLPFSPGMEVAGTIAVLGPEVEGLAVGERVMALVYDGGYAERAVAKASETFPLPDAVPSEAAAAMCSVYLTAHLALIHGARLAEGETMLVLGAAGGVGLAAVEVGHALGARVIAGASTADKLAIAAAHGAADGVDYTTTSLKDAVLGLTDGQGVDVVFDPVAGDLYEAAFGALDWGGRYMTVGFAGGAVPKFPANRLLVKNRSALGVALMYYRRRRPDLLRQSAATLANWYCEGRIRPEIAAVEPLGHAGAALRHIMERKVQGKIVLEIQPS